MGFVRGDVPEVGGGARGIPKVDKGIDGSASEGWDLEMCGIKEGPKEIRNPVPRSVY